MVYLETVGYWIAFPNIFAHNNLVALSGVRKVGFSSDSAASSNLREEGKKVHSMRKKQIVLSMSIPSANKIDVERYTLVLKTHF